MRNFKTEGIVIKRKNFGEADRILTVFTKDQGKISIKASGVRKISSRRSAHVELLNHTRLSLYKGNGWPILTEAQVIEDFSSIKADFNKVGLSYHLCELIDGLCPENQELFAVFQLLQKTLHKFCSEEEIAPIIHEFEVELLSLLGYWNNTEAFNWNTNAFIENIIERKLKSRNIFSKIQ
jgi:DNA repair protein RecO (recombination protein O)